MTAKEYSLHKEYKNPVASSLMHKELLQRNTSY